MQASINLQEWFGGIDIYLFDQLLKGRIVPGMGVLDAGCGAGRNLVYFLRSGYEVFGVDESGPQIAQLRQMAAALAPHLPAENFWVGSVERLSADFADYTDPPAMLRTLSQPKAALPHPSPLPWGEGETPKGE